MHYLIGSHRVGCSGLRLAHHSSSMYVRILRMYASRVYAYVCVDVYVYVYVRVYAYLILMK